MNRHNFDAQATTPKPQINCVCCGEPLHSYWQPALMPTKNGHWLCECQNADCRLFMYTLSADSYHTSISKYLEAEPA